MALLLKDKNSSYLREIEPDVFPLGVAHIKIFLENYYEFLALTDVELTTMKGLEVKLPMAPTKSQQEFKKYVDGEIFLKPFGMVFSGSDTKGKLKKFLFKVSEIERYTSAQYTNFIVRMNNCKRNNEGDKKELKKVINWYSEVRKAIHSVVQRLISE